jgi:hypothetical protein
MKKHQPLTVRQLDRLVDEVTLGRSDPTIAEAFILLIDEAEWVALSNALEVENVTVPVKAHAFYRGFSGYKIPEKDVEELIERRRGELAAENKNQRNSSE